VRIVQVANFYAPTSGGLRTCLDEIGRRYRDLGHERVLLVPGGADGDEMTASGRRISLRSPLLPGGRYRVLVHRSRVLDLLGRLRPDVLEVSDKLVLGWLGPWAGNAGIPAALFSHERLDAILADRIPAWFPLAATADVLNRRFAASVREVIVTSAFARAEYERAGVANLRQVPLGVDLRTFRPTAGRPAGPGVRLITVGRLSGEKAPELAIDAVRLLRADGVPASLLLVGDGPLRARLVRRAAGLPVRFLGHVPDRVAIARLVAAADIALAPCAVETFGLAVLEALACGTPAVVPAGGAARELVGAAGTGPPPDRAGPAWRLARSAAGAVFPAARPLVGPPPAAGCGVVTDGTAVGLADGVRTLLAVPAADRRAAARARAEQFPWSATVHGLLAAHGATRALAG
jgi:alpha-1,6-mannosyltransferase